MNRDFFKPVIFLLSIIIPIIIVIWAFNFDVILKEDTIKNYAKDYFTEVKTQINDDFMIVECKSNTEEDALNNLRKMYYGLSRKPKLTHINKINLTIRCNEKVLSSSLTLEQLKDTDWELIDTYEELKIKANIR